MVVPLVPAADTDTVKVFSIAVAEALAARHPDDFTVEGRIANRHGRLYLDIGRNGYAQTMAAPYAVRALPGAPVSVPLDWSELDDFDPRRHTLRTIADRLAAPDPWAGLDQAATRLDQAGARLAELQLGRVASSSQAGRWAPAPRRLPQVDRLAATSAGVAGRTRVTSSPDRP